MTIDHESLAKGKSLVGGVTMKSNVFIHDTRTYHQYSPNTTISKSKEAMLPFEGIPVRSRYSTMTVAVRDG